MKFSIDDEEELFGKLLLGDKETCELDQEKSFRATEPDID